jgi:hypothetical protein
MNINDIENVELKLLQIEDYAQLKDVMIEAYHTMPQAYWREHHIQTLLNKFPESLTRHANLSVKRPINF